MPHLDDGTLQELIDGEIPSSSLPLITEHLAACAHCRERLAVAQANLGEADALIEMLDDDVAVPTVAARGPVVSRVRQWPQRLAWAASVMIAAGLGYASRGTVVVTPTSVNPPATAVTIDAPIAESATGTVVDEQGGRPAPKPTPVATADASKPATPTPTSNRAERTQPTIGASSAPPPPSVAAVPTQALTEQRSGSAPASSESNAAGRLMARDAAVVSKQAAPARTDTISLRDAMQLLGGRLRLVDGLVPLRVESDGAAVRVVYDLGGGELVLTQRITNRQVVWRLDAPVGFPADSLARLRAAVHE